MLNEGLDPYGATAIFFGRVEGVVEIGPPSDTRSRQGYQSNGGVHWPSIPEREPAASYSIDDPNAGCEKDR